MFTCTLVEFSKVLEMDFHDQENKKSRYSTRRWAIAVEQHKNILKLLRHGVGIRRIAEIVGVGVRTVQRRKKFLNEELNRQVADEDRGVRDASDALRQAPSLVDIDRGARRCPEHGMVSVWPCVICSAIEARDVSNSEGVHRKECG